MSAFRAAMIGAAVSIAIGVPAGFVMKSPVYFWCSLANGLVQGLLEHRRVPTAHGRGLGLRVALNSALLMGLLIGLQYFYPPHR